MELVTLASAVFDPRCPESLEVIMDSMDLRLRDLVEYCMEHGITFRGWGAVQPKHRDHSSFRKQGL